MTHCRHTFAQASNKIELSCGASPSSSVHSLEVFAEHGAASRLTFGEDRRIFIAGDDIRHSKRIFQLR
jgi:hypothetical protein